MATTWVNDLDLFWGAVECDGLFFLFDRSARAHNGWPTVDSDEILDHVRDCEMCQENDVRAPALAG